MKPGKKRKMWVRVGIVIVLVLGTIEGIYWSRRIAEQRHQAEEDSRAARIMAQAADTRDYNKAREQVVAGHFNLDTIRRAVTEEIHRQTIKRVDGYFVQPPGPQRMAYLDRVIDEAVAYERFRAKSRPAPTTRPAPPATDAFVAWVSQQPAATRARLAEFGAAFNARLQQRGLPPIQAPLR
ncbi:MAG TPA: hypothetical protein VN541_22675 [Tepidisphaeraceae bacterium]|nr:hypothetical protein [Tepidisphaeraceae bacterium]